MLRRSERLRDQLGTLSADNLLLEQLSLSAAVFELMDVLEGLDEDLAKALHEEFLEW